MMDLVVMAVIGVALSAERLLPKAHLVVRASGIAMLGLGAIGIARCMV